MAKTVVLNLGIVGYGNKGDVIEIEDDVISAGMLNSGFATEVADGEDAPDVENHGDPLPNPNDPNDATTATPAPKPRGRAR